MITPVSHSIFTILHIYCSSFISILFLVLLSSILLWSRHTTEAGLLALDMLRMESGFCLPGHDFTRLETPVQVIRHFLILEMRQRRATYYINKCSG